MCIDKGRTNLYQRVDIDVYGAELLEPGVNGEGLADGTQFQYYNVGDEPTVIFPAPAAAGGVTATGTAVLGSSGLVDEVSVTAAGSGYSNAPTVK